MGCCYPRLRKGVKPFVPRPETCFLRASQHHDNDHKILHHAALNPASLWEQDRAVCSGR